jgi:hypothetical protein
LPLSLAALLSLAQKSANQELAPFRTDITTQQQRASEQAQRQAEMLRGSTRQPLMRQEPWPGDRADLYERGEPAGRLRARLLRRLQELGAGVGGPDQRAVGEAWCPAGADGGGRQGRRRRPLRPGWRAAGGNAVGQGAAFKSAADFLPASTLGRGAQAVQASNYNATLKNQEFADQLKTLDAKYPGLVRTCIRSWCSTSRSRRRRM